MAVIPNKYSSPAGNDKEKIAALERYIKYLEERIELFASSTNKKIEEVSKNVQKDR